MKLVMKIKQILLRAYRPIYEGIIIYPTGETKIMKKQHSWTLSDNQLAFDTYLRTGDTNEGAQLLAAIMVGPSWKSIKCKFRSFKKLLGGDGLLNVSADTVIVVNKYKRSQCK